MKNLANCKPSEFLVQTNKIRKNVEEWVDVTGILKIRQIQPKIPEGATEEEIRELRYKQAHNNISAMLDSILEENPEKTLELLALLCFVDPKDVDEHPVEEYLNAVSDLISNKSVLRFFVSLAQLGQMNTLNV